MARDKIRDSDMGQKEKYLAQKQLEEMMSKQFSGYFRQKESRERDNSAHFDFARMAFNFLKEKNKVIAARYEEVLKTYEIG